MTSSGIPGYPLPCSVPWQVGDEVMVHDRVGICIWDGRPEHQYARVRWDDDGSESEILPVSQITAENRCLEEARGHHLI